VSVNVPVDTVEKPMTYGRLTVLAEVRRHSRPYWVCRCECGVEKEISRRSVTSGMTRSCGCLNAEVRKAHRRTHGMSRTSTYQVWLNMVNRCIDPKDAAFSQYGGRGITVCERWRNSFENFLADMGERPSSKSIDRINNDGRYAKDNCRWATRAEQARNTARTINITIDGETLCLTDWAARAGRKYSTLYAAHRRGEDVAAILKRSLEGARR
jgi:hypothetical protein